MRILCCMALLSFGPASLVAAPTPVPPSWQQEYWAQFDKRDWDSAITSAEQLVALARPATQDTALRLAEALSLLGNAQFGKGNLVAAEAAFSEALTLAEQYAGHSSSALIDPLRGLGYTLAAQGKHATAVPYMDRALLISRRSAGLFDVSQQGLLQQLANSLAIMGTPIDGEKHMLYLLRMGKQAYGEKDPRMVSVYCTVGRWYADVAQMIQARGAYREALAVAEKNGGRSNLLVIEPLRGLARTYVEEIALTAIGIETQKQSLSAPDDDSFNSVVEPMNPRFIGPEGERALLRAVKTLDENSQRSSATLVETLVQAGDWYLLKTQIAKALPYYTRAAELISKGGNDADMASVQNLLGFPMQVYFPPPPAANRNLMLPAYAVTERFAQVEFTVEPDGTIKDERIVDKDASERQAQQLLESIRNSRYRPKFVDGQPVETIAVSYRQTFRDRRQSE